MPNGDEKTAAEMSKERGRLAVQIADPEQRRQFIARQGWLERFTDPSGQRVGYSPNVRNILESENRQMTRRTSGRTARR